MAQEQSASYRIDLDEFGIYNDGTHPVETTAGINDAIAWAMSEGYNHVLLPDGHYKVRPELPSYTAIHVPSGLHFEMEYDCLVEMETNSSPNYNVFELRGSSHAKISGGTIRGDKETHVYEIYVGFERGGINNDGSLNTNPNWIRSEVLDRYADPGLLANFRLWNTNSLPVAGYSFYQYRDTISSATFVDFRTNGLFAPGSPTGRGWFLNPDMAANNKMIFAINITGLGLTDPDIAALSMKVDNSYFTHEGGHGIGMYGANNIEVANVRIYDCIGDGILTGILQRHSDPALYTQEEMGHHITIRQCHIHHCRRQGISLCGPTDVNVFGNEIHHIGLANDGITSNSRYGTPPMFGIDIESLVSETNIPYKSPSRPDGLELNYRMNIADNHIHHNNRGHFVNCDGTFVTVQSNVFEGYNLGGILSYPNYQYTKYLNNTFIGCELTVQGDNFVNGGVFHNGSLKLMEVRGAVVQNVQIKDGNFYGNASYGYLGTPTVNVATSTFSYSSPHGMGNGAQVIFEQWVGTVPGGISVDKLYYTVNVTATAFQVAESPGGTPVTLVDAGVPGFNASRYNYGRCYISDVTIERDWRPDNSATPRFNVTVAGAVMRNITVKNYDVMVLVPQNYAGRPNTVENLTLIEGSARFECSHISGSQFLRAKTSLLGSTDIQFGSNHAAFTRRLTVQGCSFNRLGAVLEGNSLVTDCQFLNAAVGKADTANKAILANSYLENTSVRGQWLTHTDSLTLANNVFHTVTVTGTSPYVKQVDNTVL